MKILLLGGKGESTYAVINALTEQYEHVEVVLEDSVPTLTFLRRRMKKLGFLTVVGQVVFLALIPRYLRRASRRRLSTISDQYNLDLSEKFKKIIPVEYVESINSSKTLRIIHAFAPDIIVVNGTRIIAKSILDSVHVPIINMHTGITPKYRGVHGGYWAVVNQDMEHCGVTVHFINAGIDTGEIIRQTRIPVTEEDNYCTYPRLQTGEGIRLELEVLREFEETGKIETTENDLPSMIWSHPTILQYLKNRKYSK